MIQFEIPIKMWLEIFQSVIEPIVLYGSGVDPMINKIRTMGQKNSAETRHLELCRKILRIQKQQRMQGGTKAIPPFVQNWEKSCQILETFKRPLFPSFHSAAESKAPLMTDPRAPAGNNKNSQPETHISAQQINIAKIINTQKETNQKYWTDTTQKQSKIQSYLSTENINWQHI